MPNYAVIVEPRKHKAFRFVVRNVLRHLPGWRVQIFHGTTNGDYVRNIFADEIRKGRVQLAGLPVRNLGATSYNNLLTSLNFWGRVRGENVLVFQTDSMILEGGSGVGAYLQYDYVGAPWAWSVTRLKVPLAGNGGFSFRKRSAMQWAIRNMSVAHRRRFARGTLNEDVFFARVLTASKQFSVAPWDVAKTFSVEAVYHPDSFGVHKPWAHLKANYAALVRAHPEVAVLARLNGIDRMARKTVRPTLTRPNRRRRLVLTNRYQRAVREIPARPRKRLSRPK